MRRSIIILGIMLVAVPLLVVGVHRLQGSASAESRDAEAAQSPSPPPVQNPPLIEYEVVPDFFKLPPDMHFGETLGVAVNSKGTIAVINHPGSATTGPLYGNATNQVWEFDRNGKFIREIGKGVYGFGYGHAVRYDKYDNLWHVDKGTNSIVKFSPEGRVLMNLGRRPEGYDSWAPHYHRPSPAEARPRASLFDGPTDIAWDQDDNIYISEGYVNNRIAKIDKDGNWITSIGQYGVGGDNANENPLHFRNVHSMQVDRQGNIYAGDRGNRRIHVIDRNGNFLRFIHLTAPYDKKRQPVLGDRFPNPPDQTAPWAMCMTTNGPNQVLFVADAEPGRVYKLSLDGKILGMFGESGRGLKQFNWIHGIACPSEDTLFIADMNNWTVKKVLLKGTQAATAADR